MSDRQVSARKFGVGKERLYCPVSFRKGNEGIENYSRTRFSSNDSFGQLLFPNLIPIS